ncbi:anti-sigma factor [Corynebacterium freiburgense]|uniref:anti-sigma factor n=1 Tax=Corynebacterium freiburgense TaxID=556548 RepID=UPI0003FB2FB0|nr:anti-sigma factor [Corynebacterium freiburgense]WJZ01344.1 Anti-sigma-K factor rskA [Corynebacterium freiburgense]
MSNAFDEARAQDPDLADIDEVLFDAVVPVAPSPALRSEILAKISNEPQVSSLDQRRTSKSSNIGMFVAAAAAIVVLAGAGVWISNSLNGLPEQTLASSSTTSMPNILSEVMAASDARSGSGEAMGAQFEVAISEQMGKGGLMVNGAPKLDQGMGAQVWAVMPDGQMESAGIIDQSPHTDVWMPLPAKTMRVLITKEPMNGSKTPQGELLEEVTLV